MDTTAFEVVCRHDEAIDAVAMGPEGRALWMESLDNKHLRFVDGLTPVRFFCRRLKVSEMRVVLRHGEPSERYTEAFKRGLQRVDGLHADHGRRSFTHPDPERPLSDKELDATFDMQDVLEVGAAILGRSMLGKGRPAAWPQPDTLVLALEARVSRRVGEMRAQAALSAPNKQPPADLPPQTPSV
jgi:hypothetical protein